MTIKTVKLSHRPSLFRFALAGLILPFSLIVVVIALFAISEVFRSLDHSIGTFMSVALGLSMLAIGGALWANTLGHLAGLSHTRRLDIAGAVGHAAMTLLAFLVLGRLESEFVERGNTTLPIHMLFTLLFVPATFIVAAVMCGALGFAIGNGRLAIQPALYGGIAAAIAFLALNVLQDLLGRRVGGPNAAATAMMVTVTLVCNMGAAMAMSAVLGKLLVERAPKQDRSAPS